MDSSYVFLARVKIHWYENWDNDTLKRFSFKYMHDEHKANKQYLNCDLKYIIYNFCPMKYKISLCSLTIEYNSF